MFILPDLNPFRVGVKVTRMVQVPPSSARGDTETQSSVSENSPWISGLKISIGETIKLVKVYSSGALVEPTLFSPKSRTDGLTFSARVEKFRGIDSWTLWSP